MKTVRESVDNPADRQAFTDLARATGVRFDLFIAPGSVGFTQQLQWLSEVSPIVAYLEGPNESDTWTQTYNGLSGLPATRAEQAELYAFKRKWMPTVPVINASFGQAATFPSVGDLSASADYANAHQYFGTGNNPGAGTQIKLVENNAQSVATGKPLVITESGYSTIAGSVTAVSPAVQAKYDLDLLFDEWQTGAKLINLYELVDQQPAANPGNIEYGFGLFNYDFTPKPAADAVRNTLAVMQSSGPANLASLDYSITGMPASANSQMFQKGDGSYALVLWNDVRLSGPTTQTDITVAPVPVTLTLDQVQKHVRVYDPLAGVMPVQDLSDASQVKVSLPDHPVIVLLSQSAIPDIVLTTPALTVTSVAPTPATPVLSVPATAVAGPITGITLCDAYADYNPGGFLLKVSAGKGTVAMNDWSGAAVPGSGTGAISYTATFANVAAALASLTYVGTGKDTLTITIWDQAGLNTTKTVAVN